MARRKVTEADSASDDLPLLTEKQQKFVDCLLSGMSASDAYRQAYDCSGSKDSSVWVEASKLRNNPKITRWLAAATKAGLAIARVSVEQHLDKLSELREMCVESGNLGAAVQAEQLRGKVLGYYKEQLEVSHVDPLEALEELHKIEPKLAVQTAKEFGISWNPTTKH